MHSDKEILPQDYSFFEGVNATARHIQILFQSLDRDIIIEINNSGINVGNMQFLRALGQELRKLNIPISILNDPTLKCYEEMRELNAQSNNGKPEKCVYIIGTTIKKFYYSTPGYRQITRSGHDSLVVDLYVGLWTPDKPFRASSRDMPVADIMVCNETAIHQEPA